MSHKHDHEHGAFSYEYATHLLNPLRKILILSPKKLVKRLDLRKDSKVLEVGPGPGFFTVEVARSIPAGTLVLVDIHQEMLDMAKQRIEKEGISNVEYVRGDAVTLHAESECYDVVFLAAVLGELTNQSQFLREAYRVLRPNGLLSITEQPHDPHFMPSTEVRRIVEELGFSFERTFGRAKNYTVNFRKPARG